MEQWTPIKHARHWGGGRFNITLNRPPMNSGAVTLVDDGEGTAQRTVAE
jgi:hypothetical protein